MKKYLFILKTLNDSFLVLENNKMKCFEGEEIPLNDLDLFLEGKVNYSKLDIVDTEKFFYLEEEYNIVILNILSLNDEIKDKDIQNVSKIEDFKLGYRDFEIVKELCKREYNYNLKLGFKENEREVTLTKTVGISSIILGLILTFFVFNSEGFIFRGIWIFIVALIVTTLGIVTSFRGGKINYKFIYFSFLGVMLSLTYSIFTNPIFIILNLIFVTISIMIGLYFLNFDSEFNRENILNDSIKRTILNLLCCNNINLITASLGGFKLKRKNKNLNSILKGLIISIPLLIVLVILLSASDSNFEFIISKGIGEIFNIFYLENFKIVFFKLIFFSVAFIFIYNFYIGFNIKFEKRKLYKVKKLDDILVATILSVINILYLAFLITVFLSVFSKSNISLNSAYDYSSYARNGFFQLVIVLLINIFLVIYFKSRTLEKDKIKILNSITTAMSIVMAFISIYKMSLYVSEFGLTRLRFLTTAFTIFIVISLVFIFISLFKKINIFKIIIIIGSIIYLILNYINMDKIIAGYNLNSKGKNIDITYITTLSGDAYEEVLKAFKENKIEREEFDYYLSQKTISNKWYDYNYYNSKM
ncbi:DUF4173 domain-containing protein [Clostridium sp. LY3-2]|uniref:DUF4153 domain-containing protein n=1 Tax=Clostridium sp. LY3-2 TaxID=2942482 RepID=UPI002152C6EB|nr:DUF4153 domain-containing protein [Clostridium sp. LY3-2]MCR6515991.1 DUF4173 domain-containing protein [Clostridium sp. LY3-2]